MYAILDCHNNRLRVVRISASYATCIRDLGSTITQRSMGRLPGEITAAVLHTFRSKGDFVVPEEMTVIHTQKVG